MKQILQNFKTGEVEIADVPAPVVRPGFVLVANECSAVSAGTEGGTVRLGRMNLLQKARARPEQVKKVLTVVQTDGPFAAYQAVRRSIDTPVPLGYSSCGRILEVGEGVEGLRPGELVACGGAGYANHAEIVCVPRHLVVEVADQVAPKHASFTTLGAIALQSLRVAEVQLGESVVVVGLGLVGLLAAQLLKAAGVRVVGVDVDEGRVRLAREQGFCDDAATRGADNLEERMRVFTGGSGADAVIITAATANNDPLRLAGRVARHKGRVIVVGRTRMHAPRETYLFKELELRTSLAYGPGTGDPAYEEKGHDYPLPYVRWTENRNMQAFVRLLADRKVHLDPMISHEFPISEGAKALELVTGLAKEPALGVILNYAGSKESVASRVTLAARAPARQGALGISVIGAGSFATNTLVPLLAKTPGLALRGIASASGVRARALGEKYGFAFCAADPGEVFADPQTDGVVILTRHDTHAALTMAALDAGKRVLVEKPIAMSVSELQGIVTRAATSGLPVQVGFNRRFAPLALTMKAFFKDRAQPMTIIYRANVGRRPTDHWLHDPVQGGGVILGEAVHFVDFCHWLVGTRPVEVSAHGLHSGDGEGETGTPQPAADAHICVRFGDGSVATIIYVSNGDASFSRERIEAYADAGVAVLEDFRRLTRVRGGRQRRLRRRQDRGYAAQIKALMTAWRGGPFEPPLEASALSTLATLEAVEALKLVGPVRIDAGKIGL